jgi:hypothetical protein
MKGSESVGGEGAGSSVLRLLSTPAPLPTSASQASTCCLHSTHALHRLGLLLKRRTKTHKDTDNFLVTVGDES